MIIFPLDPCDDPSLKPLRQQAVYGLDKALERADEVLWLTLRGGQMGGIGPITLTKELLPFSKLRVLELEHYSEVHLTEVVTELPALHTLILLGNEFAPSGMSIGPHLDQIDGLRGLYLDGFFPLSLTDEISRCDSLRTLWVEDCEIEGKEVITSLTRLEELSIDFDLGDDLARLTHLKRLRLFLDGNVPESIRDLELQTLALRSVGPMVLPDWLGQMTCLRELDLSNCDIDEIPDGFSTLERLEVMGTPLRDRGSELQARFPNTEIVE